MVKKKRSSTRPYKVFLIFLNNLMYYIFCKIFKRNRKQKPYARKFRKSLVNLGPTYIKLGQMLSTRYDLFSKEILNELSKLQDDVLPLPYEDMKRKMEGHYGNIDRYFSGIDKDPIASASIAQVYRAWLKDGTKVAVKVRRPGIRKIVSGDIRSMMRIARIMDLLPLFKQQKLKEVVNEFGKSIKKEMDFSLEARSITKFSRDFRKDEIIHAPRVIRRLTYRDILVMEYIDGVSLSEVLSGKYDKEKYPIKKSNLLKSILDSMMEQIFIHGMIHGDPHPGNMIVTTDGKLYFIDFGRVKYLEDDLRSFLLEYLISVTRRDAEMLTEIIDDNFGVDDKESYAKAMGRLFAKYYGKDLDEIDIGELMVDSFITSRIHGVKLPASVFMMSRAILILEGIGTRLDPKFDYISYLKKYFTRKRILTLLRKRMDEMREDAVWNMVMLPRKMREFDRMITGKKKLQFKLPRLERTMRDFVRGINSLAIAVIVAALLLSIHNFEISYLPGVVIVVLSLYIIYQLMFKQKGR